MSGHILLIDGNSIGHANHNATKLSVGGFQTQAIFGFLNSLRMMLGDRPDSRPIVLWDGETNFRHSLFPEYKTNRVDDSDPVATARRQAYRAQRPFIYKFLDLLAVTQMTASDLEADDLAASVSWSYAKAGQRVTLVSGDKDWLQLINTNVDWYDPIRRVQVNQANLFTATGFYTPYEFLQGKALQGDSSDNIPGVGGIGEKGAQELLARFHSVEEFWRQCDEGLYTPTTKALKSLWKGTCAFTKAEWESQYIGPGDSKSKKKHMDAWPGQGRTIFERNMQLMRLDPNRKVVGPTLNMNRGTFNEDGFVTLASRLAFNSILLDLKGFLQPFRPVGASAPAKAA